MAKVDLTKFLNKKKAPDDLSAFFELLKRQRGEDGKTPVIDYDHIVRRVFSMIEIPRARHGLDGETPKKHVDYFTQAEVAEFLKKTTPVKGLHYTDGKDADEKKILSIVFKRIQEELGKINIEPKDTAEEIVGKINDAKKKINAEQVEGFSKLLKDLENMGANLGKMRQSISMAGQNSVILKDNGSALGHVETFNIVGAAITKDSTGREATINIPAGDNIHEYANLAAFPATGTAENLYIALDTSILYYWDGAAYEALSSGGGGGGDTFYDNETPSGAINGVNTTYTLIHAPSGSSLRLYQNGVLLTGGGVDYTLSSATITFGTAIPIEFAGLPFVAFYRTTSAASYGDNETPSGTINGSNAVFTLAHAPAPAESLQLSLNGVLLTQGVDYALSGVTITFVTAPAVEFSGLPFLANYRY